MIYGNMKMNNNIEPMWVNYHKHTSLSNVYTKDSPIVHKDYWDELKKRYIPIFEFNKDNFSKEDIVVIGHKFIDSDNEEVIKAKNERAKFFLSDNFMLIKPFEEKIVHVTSKNPEEFYVEAMN